MAEKTKRRASRKRRKLDKRGRPVISDATRRKVRATIGHRRPGMPPSKYRPELAADMVDYFQDGLDNLVDPERITTDKGAVSFLNKPVRPRTFAGFAAQIHVSRITLWRWRQEYEEFADAYDLAQTIYEQILLEMGTMGGWNQRMAEFLLKNHHGYTDKAEVLTTGEIKLVIDEQDARHFNTD